VNGDTRLGRRDLLAGGAALTVIGCAGKAIGEGERAMYGLIGTIRAKAGERDALIGALGGGGEPMPGNLSYVVAEDAAESDLIWVTETWDSEASHRASLALPRVQEAIRRARPLIAGLERVATTRPVSVAGPPD
jgi:quinol monooxygenase YgiN